MAITRVLIANRGEIAVRINRAAHALGIETVQVVSEADRDSLPARLADRVLEIGPAPARNSYLDAKLIVTAALVSGCDALHPGYGFLSERAELAELCADEGIAFIGPRAETIAALGNKLQARALAERAGVPLTPGTDSIKDIDEAIAYARKIGFPLLVKAASGGGGRGMFIAHNPDDLRATFQSAASEAQEAFGDGTLYMERYVENARHIEVQILGDGNGRVIHFGERDCSIQRRYQKVIEEAPAAALPKAVRKKLFDSTIAFASSLKYLNAGTVEYLYDIERREFYFMEVNTRIQVEHPVSEEVTDQDLLQWQFRVARGEPLPDKQQDIAVFGHSIECRINAEDPANNFVPAPGVITKWVVPQGLGVRVDSHCYEGYRVPPFYDSMLAKLIVSGRTREDAVKRLAGALASFSVEGITTNLELLKTIVNHVDFKSNALTTKWLEKTLLPRFVSRNG